MAPVFQRPVPGPRAQVWVWNRASWSAVVQDASLRRQAGRGGGPGQADGPTGLGPERLAARLLLRRALARALGVAPQAVELASDAMGAPRVVGPRWARSWRVSMTHCAELVACVVADGAAVGVDAEPCARQIRCLDALARRLHPAEATWLGGQPKSERPRQFLRLWTLKEALGKALGLGLRMPLAASHIDPGPPVTARLLDPGRHGHWALWQVQLPSGHFLAVATEARRHNGLPQPPRVCLGLPS